MKLALSGTCRSDFRLFVRSNIPGLPVHSLLTASHAKPAQTSTVPRWVMTEFQPSGPFATLEPSTAVDPKRKLAASSIPGLADRIFLARSGSDQLLEGDRKAADANPGRVPHSIGDRPGRARNADLTDAFDAERIHVRVGLINQDGLERRHVSVNRHVILGQVRVHDPA